MRRFVEEAQSSGQLQHPGIPPVHELGRLPDGRPVLRHEAGPGPHPGRPARGARRPGRDLPRFLAIFEQVCQAVAYAHSRASSTAT